MADLDGIVDALLVDQAGYNAAGLAASTRSGPSGTLTWRQNVRLLTRWKRTLFSESATPGVPGCLTGRYDIRGDRLSGWVDGEQMRGDGGLIIEAKRHNEVIAACAAVPDASRARRFTLCIQGRFASTELVTEAVVITARNERGDTGILKLDGATQLGLIREIFTKPATKILDLDFTLGGNATPYLGDGWSSAEKDFTWTEGNNSFITFDTPREAGAYFLRITIGAFIQPPTVSSQATQIFVNDVENETLQLAERHIRFNEIKLNSASFSTEPQTTLRFFHPSPIRPCDLLGTNLDHRRLALCFKRLTIVRLLSAGDC